ncbi:MAG TPA: nuclear transport factor 2 family protein [Candidatus Acidoferrales bacterium]|nr:nuclear transport factor 2 family protein [Candidatus Acidoferrales bacterium]
MAETRSERVVKRFFKTLSTGNLERLRALLHEDATWTVMGTGIPGAGEKKGRHAIIDEFLGPARGMFVPGDPKIHLDRVISKGPVVAVEARGLGRFKNGKEYNNRYAFMVEVKGDKVFALKEYMDSYHVSTLV